MSDRSAASAPAMTLREELEATRASVDRLSERHRGQTRIVWALVVIVVVMAALTFAGMRSLADARCHGDQEAALNARAANEAIVTSAARRLAGDPPTPEQTAAFEQFQADLAREQERLIPVPEC